jgi:hypothetical protein
MQAQSLRLRRRPARCTGCRTGCRPRIRSLPDRGITEHRLSHAHIQSEPWCVPADPEDAHGQLTNDL